MMNQKRRNNHEQEEQEQEDYINEGLSQDDIEAYESYPRADGYSDLNIIHPNITLPLASPLHIVTELLITLITNSPVSEWFESLPFAPTQFLSRTETLLSHFDSELSQHFDKCNISASAWCWNPLSMLFAESMQNMNEWGVFMDHLIFDICSSSGQDPPTHYTPINKDQLWDIGNNAYQVNDVNNQSNLTEEEQLINEQKKNLMMNLLDQADYLKHAKPDFLTCASVAFAILNRKRLLNMRREQDIQFFIINPSCISQIETDVDLLTMKKKDKSNMSRQQQEVDGVMSLIRQAQIIKATTPASLARGLWGGRRPFVRLRGDDIYVNIQNIQINNEINEIRVFKDDIQFFIINPSCIS
ncbi:MAG: hypothetical protein EZS28_013825 [Streblomastix strix]|uniref:Uncharacterized protein n=1 Tax=Streblomastix strix TaxID=222440 RepID=A0A5J4W7G1_9EUKA|nr:MAG: hypothetical protein EZS28_013825 [Streblomastix strix]